MKTPEDEEFERIENEIALKGESKMKIDVEFVNENADGSCNVKVTTDREGSEFIFKYGIVAAIKDAIHEAKEKYLPEEPKETSDNQLINLQAELDSMRDILGTYDEELRQANEQIVRLQREPLSEERIVALYRRSMDWRQFARDIEAEHGVTPKAFDISVPEEDGYDE